MGDLINEPPVGVGMRGRIRHKSKITQLNLGAERASQSVKHLHVFHSLDWHLKSGSWVQLIDSETGSLCRLSAYTGSN